QRRTACVSRRISRNQDARAGIVATVLGVGLAMQGGADGVGVRVPDEQEERAREVRVSARHRSEARTTPALRASSWRHYVRSGLKPARTSSAKSRGCSQAAKCPPLSSLL